MAKTSDALKILDRLTGEDPVLRKRIAKEARRSAKKLKVMQRKEKKR